MPTPFLTATWSHLAMLNYEVPAAELAPFVPKGVALDSFRNRSLVSIVGFLFEHTRLRGLPIPFHQRFEEVNLRFYVRRTTTAGEVRRGVTFIREIVPRFFVARIANHLYNERYVSMPMRHDIDPARKALYAWRHKGRWNSLEVAAHGTPSETTPGSEEEFITEHYWGYTAQPDGSTLEYQVTHPKWRVQRALRATLDCDIADLYGNTFTPYLKEEPSSAFLAEGSPVTVFQPDPVR